MTYFNGQCERLCSNTVISQSLTVVTVNGTDTLLIDIPAGTYANGCCYSLIIAQNRPTTATVDMPVAISINGNTTTVYPLICNRTCLQATACQISGRTRIKAIVQTNTTSGVFRACSGLGSCCYQRLTSLPVTTTTPATPATVQLSAEVENSTAPKTTRVVTNTTKEVISHE